MMAGMIIMSFLMAGQFKMLLAGETFNVFLLIGISNINIFFLKKG